MATISFWSDFAEANTTNHMMSSCTTTGVPRMTVR